MPPRFLHTKSRQGCQRCKLRKVKCDEKRPVCSACARHRVACNYALNGTTASLPLEHSRRGRPPINTGVADNGPAIPYAHDALESFSHEQRRTLELYLLHHFSSATTATFPGSLGDEQSRACAIEFCNEEIRLGFEHPFLLSTIFAVASLHLAVVPPLRKPEAIDFDFARVHRMYLNLAVQGVRGALADINTTNANAVCCACLLLNMIANRLLPNDELEDDPYASLVQRLTMSNSISAISQATHTFLGDYIRQYMRNTNGPDFRDNSMMLDFEYGDSFRAILNFDDGTEVVTEEDREVYDEALAYIGGIQRAVKKPELPAQICRRLMGFAAVVPTHFIKLAAEHRPRALAIIANQMAMAKYADKGFWWFTGIAERDVYAIQKLLPEKWQWAMEAPLAILAALHQEDSVSTERKLQSR